MGKKYYLPLLLLVSFIFAACDDTTQNEETSGKSEASEEVLLEPASESEYVELVEDFTKISIDNLNTKVSNKESFNLYIGRKTCSYCRIFVPKLHTASQNSEAMIFYLDVENANTNQDDEVELFLSTVNLQYVPSLISFNDGDFTMLDIDSENITIEEIENFIK